MLAPHMYVSFSLINKSERTSVLRQYLRGRYPPRHRASAVICECSDDVLISLFKQHLYMRSIFYGIITKKGPLQQTAPYISEKETHSNAEY